MTALLQRVYAALSTLPCAVTRLWPQALVPLPSVAFGIASAAGESSGTRCTLRAEVRAQAPEAADTLAASALERLTALGFALNNWRDGEAADSGCFTVTLDLGGLFSPDGLPVPPAQVQVAQGLSAAPVGGILRAEPLVMQRDMADITQAADPVRRFAPEARDPGRVHMRARTMLQDAGQNLLRAAFLDGTALTVTLNDPPNNPVTAQGYVAQITAAGTDTEFIIQLTG